MTDVKKDAEKPSIPPVSKDATFGPIDGFPVVDVAKAPASVAADARSSVLKPSEAPEGANIGLINSLSISKDAGSETTKPSITPVGDDFYISTNR